MFGQYTVLIYVAAIVSLLFAGWEIRGWYDKSHTKDVEAKVIDNLGKGQSNIVKFNQDLDKVRTDDKTDCYNKPHGAAIGKLLH